MDIDPRPSEHLALSMQWEVIGIFADDDVGDGAFCEQTALDQDCRYGRVGDALGAGAAGVFGADGADHAQLRVHDVQPLGATLADPVHLPAAARAVQAVGLDNTLDPRQICREVATVGRGENRDRKLAPALQHEAPALIAGLSAASSGGRAVAGSAFRSRFAGHTRRSAQTRHAPRVKPDHPIGAGQRS